VLWAKGGEDERNVAREQLFECVETNPQHVGAIVLLGVMAAIEEDAEMIGTVREELEGLRVSEGISERDEGKVERVLEALAEIDSAERKDDLKAMNEIQRAIMITPGKPTGWGRLADLVEDQYPAELALITAENNVPPKGDLTAEELAAAFAGTGAIGDAQRAIMSAPWAKCGWDAFVEVLS
jgi:superkiller protein 3